MGTNLRQLEDNLGTTLRQLFHLSELGASEAVDEEVDRRVESDQPVGDHIQHLQIKQFHSDYDSNKIIITKNILFNVEIRIAIEY